MNGQDMFRLLENGAESKKRPQQAVCYRAEDETGASDLEETRGSQS